MDEVYLGSVFEDFADYFANVPVPSAQIPADSGHLGGFIGFSFRHSTATVLVRVTEDLGSAKAEEKSTVYVLLDFPKLLTLLIMGCLFISSTHGMTFICQLWAMPIGHGFIVSSGSFYGR
jgi:hypothetical protein